MIPGGSVIFKAADLLALVTNRSLWTTPGSLLYDMETSLFPIQVESA